MDEKLPHKFKAAHKETADGWSKLMGIKMAREKKMKAKTQEKIKAKALSEFDRSVKVTMQHADDFIKVAQKKKKAKAEKIKAKADKIKAKEFVKAHSGTED